MRWTCHPSRLQRTQLVPGVLLSRVARRYARHGWHVVPGAYRAGRRFACDRAGCHVESAHPALEDWESAATTDLGRVAGWWHRAPYTVLLATGHAFDVIEVPSAIGAAATHLLAARGVRCPVATTPTGRWMFFVSPGHGLRPELSALLGVLLHGHRSWVPAPPSHHPEGKVRWVVSPAALGWKIPDSYAVQQALVDTLPTESLAPVRPAYPRPRRIGSLAPAAT